jgi:hypothetical protein
MLQAKSTGAKTQSLQFIVTVTDGNHLPIAGRKVTYGFFYPLTMRDVSSVQTTSISGQISIACPLPPRPEDRYLYVAAGTDSPEHIHTSDLQIFTLQK